MHFVTISSLVGKIINVAFIGAIIYFYWTKPNNFVQTNPTAFYWLIASGVMGNLVMTGLTYWYVRRFTTIRCRWDWSFAKHLIITAFPYGIALFLNTIYVKIDIILLSWLKNSTEVGLYGVATKVLEVLGVFPQLFLSSVLPVMTRYLVSEKDKARQLFEYSFQFLLMMAVPIVIGTYLFAYQIVYLIADPEFLSNLSQSFVGSDIALKIIIFTLLFSFTNSLFGYSLVALNKQKYLLWINGGCVFFNTLLNLVFIPWFSFRASAVITVLSEIFILLFTVVIVYRSLKFRLDWWWSAKIVVAGLVMGIVLNISKNYWLGSFHNLGILGLVAMGAIVYGGMLLLLGAINKKLLRLFLKRHEPTEIDSNLD